jgi:hypothetical protein
MSTVQKIEALLAKQPGNVDIYILNLFNGKLARWTRYYTFLEIILRRYQEASEAFCDSAERGRNARLNDPVGSGELDADRLRAFEHEKQLALAVHLETESFYLFAKILLDQAAGTCGFYFSDRPKWSHKQLTDAFPNVCSKRSLNMTPKCLYQMMIDLEKEVIEFRNERVQHATDPRMRHGTVWAGKGARMLTHLVFPSNHEEALAHQKTSGNLVDIFGQIDEYLSAMLDFFAANSAQSKLPGHVGF